MLLLSFLLKNIYPFCLRSLKANLWVLGSGPPPALFSYGKKSQSLFLEWSTPKPSILPVPNHKCPNKICQSVNSSQFHLRAVFTFGSEMNNCLRVFCDRQGELLLVTCEGVSRNSLPYHSPTLPTVVAAINLGCPKALKYLAFFAKMFTAMLWLEEPAVITDATHW